MVNDGASSVSGMMRMVDDDEDNSSVGDFNRESQQVLPNLPEELRRLNTAHSSAAIPSLGGLNQAHSSVNFPTQNQLIR